MYTDLEKSQADNQGICLGNDDDNEAPTGCFIIKDTLVNMGVIHQWILLFQNGGWSKVEDQAEVRIIKYPWQRDSRHSDIDCEHLKHTS
jgi:hypothetical protein